MNVTVWNVIQLICGAASMYFLGYDVGYRRGYNKVIEVIRAREKANEEKLVDGIMDDHDEMASRVLTGSQLDH